MDTIQQQSHRPLKPMVDPHQHQDQNQKHPPGVPWYPGQFQYQSSGTGAPPQQWVPSHHHNPSMDQSMQGQHQQPQQYPPGHGFNPIQDMYTHHQGQQDYPPPPQPPMPPHQVTHMYSQPDQINKRGDSVDEKVKKLDIELARYNEQIKNTRPSPAQEAIKARAMRIIKQNRINLLQRSNLQSLDMEESSGDGDNVCPLCAEEMDLTDKQLKPCQCGYESTYAGC